MEIKESKLDWIFDDERSSKILLRRREQTDSLHSGNKNSTEQGFEICYIKYFRGFRFIFQRARSRRALTEPPMNYPMIKHLVFENKIRIRRECDSNTALDVATVVRTITPVKTRTIKSRLSASWLSFSLFFSLSFSPTPPSFLSSPRFLAVTSSSPPLSPTNHVSVIRLLVIWPPITYHLSKLPARRSFALTTVDFPPSKIYRV